MSMVDKRDKTSYIINNTIKKLLNDHGYMLNRNKTKSFDGCLSQRCFDSDVRRKGKQIMKYLFEMIKVFIIIISFVFGMWVHGAFDQILGVCSL